MMREGTMPDLARSRFDAVLTRTLEVLDLLETVAAECRREAREGGRRGEDRLWQMAIGAVRRSIGEVEVAKELALLATEAGR